ncbi:unnamed protein product [Eruca vesicaria subsp. sativa]|uniref:KIB1-4 beta-propeller domain-containing protein n=1 Tax=Eruca vesicaria subsp. sativa TaxID=29727 RepID=A0ABC8KB87_ERUVS|nr:unnamed protein product [Eruca vesicaria subsp. sativa]
MSETPIYRIVRADNCRYSSRDEKVSNLVVRNVNASEEDEDEVLEKMVPTDLMTATGTIGIGASQGWVATLKDQVLCLQDDLNPFASESDPKRVSLACPKTLPHCQTQMVTNIAMSSSSPWDEECILAVKFLGPQLSLCRPGCQKEKWVNIRIKDQSFFSSRVMYSEKDKMFSMVGRGGTHTGSWDFESQRFRDRFDFGSYKEFMDRSHDFTDIRHKEFVQSEMEELSRCSRSEHLVEAPSGQTFIVKWYTDICYEDGVPRSKCFMVFEFLGGECIATDDIKEFCIFLSSKGEPFCVEADLYGLTPNCIYYVSDFDYGKVNLGNDEWVGGNGFFPAPYFIPPQTY